MPQRDRKVGPAARANTAVFMRGSEILPAGVKPGNIHFRLEACRQEPVAASYRGPGLKLARSAILQEFPEHRGQPDAPAGCPAFSTSLAVALLALCFHPVADRQPERPVTMAGQLSKSRFRSQHRMWYLTWKTGVAPARLAGPCWPRGRQSRRATPCPV